MLDGLTDLRFHNDLISESTCRLVSELHAQHVGINQNRSSDAKKSGSSDQYRYLVPGVIEVMPTI